ncbi:hypothetical protein [Embleya sp. NPDC050493]|uniref:hypothetical protein n=1 Tax=Embleya sp. NPDC050493 TaxID=3363989 RepID=UPI00378A2F5B
MDMDVFERASRRVLERHRGDRRGRMLHSAGLRTAGRFYAFVTGDDLTVKLPAPRVSELIATGAGRPCEPRRGRPMRQWVRVTPAGADACTAYLLEARAFVAGLDDRRHETPSTRGEEQ